MRTGNRQEDAPPSPRVQRATANFGLAVASCIIFLAFLEGGVRLYERLRAGTPFVIPDAARDLYITHPYLPVVLRPSTEYRDADMAAHINAQGLRGPERDAARTPGSWRVVCVGGSTTFGAGIVGDENTWPARLEERLSAARPDLRVEVLNAGVPGYTTAENVIYLSLRLLDLEPDLVVLYEGYNDFKPNRHPGFVSDYSHWRDREAPPQAATAAALAHLTRFREVLDHGTFAEQKEFLGAFVEGITLHPYEKRGVLQMRDMIAASFCTTGWTPDVPLKTPSSRFKTWAVSFRDCRSGWRKAA